MSDKKTAELPNILIIQVDQMAAPALPIYGHPVVKAPHISALAEQGVVFENAYCNFPICAPSRYSMLTGKLPNAIDAFDNASELPAERPTLAHYLCAMGYQTTLCGKMHFVGPDQLHGFEDRLLTDIYPANFSWTPDWRKGPTDAPTGISVSILPQSGKCLRSMQIDYDDEVEYHGIQKIYDLARSVDTRPFFLTISFTHPHSPYTSSEEHWDRYKHDDVKLPTVGPLPLEDLDAHSRWLYHSHGRDRFEVKSEDVRNARHAYYGMISYIDDKIGRVLKTLKDTGLDENTIIVFTGDHGEMLGERGMWFKQTFFEWSSRVPLVVSYPKKFKPARQSAVVSLVDLVPTLLDLVEAGKSGDASLDLDGHSMIGLLDGDTNGWADTAYSEYTDMGVTAPCRMLRKGNYKYIYTHGFPAMLFDLAADPDELVNRVDDPELALVKDDLANEVLKDWDPEEINRRVLASQQRRLHVESAMKQTAKYPNWSYEIRQGDKQRFVRGSGAASGAAGTKARARFPFVGATPSRE